MVLQLFTYFLLTTLSVVPPLGATSIGSVGNFNNNFGGTSGTQAYFPDWGIGGRPTQPTCVDIPRNMSLCRGIGYHKMRLPNLLDHDTMIEVSQQSASWVALINVRCHADTQLFLCSLFSPVCLDRPIFPCRSLCEKVKQGCESRMKTYGYPWPDMLKCDKFPLDNDMCITSQYNTNSTEAERCQACNQVDTYENILDNFCRADFAVRGKFRRIRKNKLIFNKTRVFKGGNPGERELMRQLRHPTFLLQPSDACCKERTRGSREFFLIMGHYREGKLVPSFVMPWGKRSKPFKKAIRMFKKINCSDPKLVSHSVIVGDGFTPNTAAGRRKRGKGKGRRKKNNSTTTIRPRACPGKLCLKKGQNTNN